MSFKHNKFKDPFNNRKPDAKGHYIRTEAYLDDVDMACQVLKKNGLYLKDRVDTLLSFLPLLDRLVGEVYPNTSVSKDLKQSEKNLINKLCIQVGSKKRFSK